MTITLGDYPQILLLVLARIVALLMSVPFYGQSAVPVRVKVMTALVISLAVLPVLPDGWAAASGELNTLPLIVIAMLNEILIGAGVGFICNCALAVCSMAGYMSSWSSSLMMARTLDPVGGNSNVIISQIMQMLFIALVLISNAHLVLVKLVVMSFQNGQEPMAWLQTDFAYMVSIYGSRIFMMGVKLAMPVICVALIINVCMGLIARMAPDFNVLFLSLPIRMITGIVAFGLVITFNGEFFDELIMNMIDDCGLFLQL